MGEKPVLKKKENLLIILDCSCFQEISKKANWGIFRLVCSQMLALTSLVTGADSYRSGSLQFCTLPKHLDVRSHVPCGKWPKKILNYSNMFNILLMGMLMHIKGGRSATLSQ